MIRRKFRRHVNAGHSAACIPEVPVTCLIASGIARTSTALPRDNIAGAAPLGLRNHQNLPQPQPEGHPARGFAAETNAPFVLL